MIFHLKKKKSLIWGREGFLQFVESIYRWIGTEEPQIFASFTLGIVTNLFFWDSAFQFTSLGS